MAIFVCTQCGHTEEAPDEFIGRKARCLNCQTRGTIQPRSLQPDKPTVTQPPVPHQPETAAPPLDFLEEDASENKPAVKSITDRPLLITLIVLVAAVLGTQFLSLLLNSSIANRWEYEIISPLDSELIEDLNLKGAEGWEIVTARRASGRNDRYGYELLLKRKK